MADDFTAKNLNNGQSELVTLFEQVSALFSANDIEVTDSLMKRMTQLVNNNQNFKEHRASLKAQLSELE
jgi:hypothetical protein